MTATMATSEIEGNLTNDLNAMKFDVNVPISFTIVIVLLMIVVIIGVLGNFMVIVIVFKDSAMRTTPNAMVASLAVADLLVLLMSVPYKIIFLFTQTWPFGHIWCKIVHHLAISCGLVSVYSLVALSADRYHAIVRPTSYIGTRSACKLSCLVGSVWVISIALGIPNFIYARKIPTLHPQISFCFIDMGKYKEAYTITFCILMFVFPLVLISIYYSMVSWRLLRSAWAIPGDANEKRPQLRSRRRLAVVVLAIVVLFAILWFPHICIRLFLQFHPDPHTLQGLADAKLFSEVIKYLNPCINPYILCFISSTYRKHFRRTFCWLCSRKRRFDRARSLTLSSKGSSTRTKFTEFLPM
ncbi:neuromedin-B receptor-like [Lytechinus variegatus]|uniref:neuromedin-B receptor-like n=1 Tax=Lytechinus variegatus TaxID=7654 RepID=UPI001BB12A11|nr:neuromedin-B receptor-like [Lytechinus variegatus]